ncbi:TetR/AcrR family transcriptional regulator [Hahella ganghwensis]|uniref:TetR/AcrR family transcriptional regulator n=1 Tax=Hahella ganghwensis TaxID=286420 RepID=UPI0003731E7B|nr:TetR/AcrR family transcriptional regulator [Hahella ganghwensis]
MKENPTRAGIVEAADRLIYQQGYEHTSFKNIADAVNISRGNFYYHFKSKDEILDAVIEFRLAKTRKIIEQWELQGDTAEARIRCFIHILIVNQEPIMQYGCPVGSLCSELAKLNHPSQPEANKLFTLFHDWLSQQFLSLGCAQDADRFAMHLLARSQGVATLANAFQDEGFVKEEVKLMNEWLQACIDQAAKTPRR